MIHYSAQPGQYALTGWQTIAMRCVDDGREQARAEFVPALGSNLISWQVEGVEYLVAVGDALPPQRILGNPILYPTPNRVRDAQFTFGGHTYRFPANDGSNFLHGLVRAVPWACAEPVVTGDSVVVRTWVRFEPGQPFYALFPIRNSLELTYTLKPRSLRLDFRIQNEDDQPLPFGLAIHPFFRTIGPRESVRLHVPARKWMEAVDLLPTGRLVDLEQGPADLRQPTALATLDLDDVFWGMEPQRPCVICYDQIGKKMTLAASDLFTHCVVYTPQAPGYFCVEDQSCSTDAHNLYARGLQHEAHLTILPPGEALAAWVELSVSEQ